MSSRSSVRRPGNGRRISSNSIESIHLLLLIEQWKPLPRQPVNQRVIHQFSAVIGLWDLDNLNTNTTTDQEGEDQEKREKQEKTLNIVQMDCLDWVKFRYGNQSTIAFNNTPEWKVTAQEATKLEPNSTLIVKHRIIKRKVASQEKISDAVEKINVCSSRSTATCRLDELQLDESTLPKSAFYLCHNTNLQTLNLSHSNFLVIPLKLFDNFQSLTTLNLSHNLNLHTLPSEIKNLTSLQQLILVDCLNLISLPLSLTRLKNSLSRIELFGCTNLCFPPHAVALQLGLAAQFGCGSRTGVAALLDYMLNPTSLLSSPSSANGNAKNKDKTEKISKGEKLYVTVPNMIQAFGESYFEYEIKVQCDNYKWYIRRRFGQFRKFYSQLKKLLPVGIPLPPMPQPTWSFHATDPATTAHRRSMFNAFFIGLCDEENEKRFNLSLASLPCVRQFLEIEFFVERAREEEEQMGSKESKRKEKDKASDSGRGSRRASDDRRHERSTSRSSSSSSKNRTGDFAAF